jgi:ssDNA-binding Zn-finger/Zn-ribbon topoisomerase 1
VTSDAPFRYVGCSGQPNEDDYEGHEFLVFMLREGPLQRCPACGQVYKLVRLRNEFSDEMEYYKSSTVPLDLQELGQADHWHQFNPLRVATPTWEHSLFEQKSNNVYSLVNPEDHDRILVDPAYRVEKMREIEEKANMYN